MKVAVPTPIPLPQRMRELADRLDNPIMQTLYEDVATARELLRIGAKQVELTTAQITSAASAFDRAREKLDQFLAGEIVNVSAYCDECGVEL